MDQAQENDINELKRRSKEILFDCLMTYGGLLDYRVVEDELTYFVHGHSLNFYCGLCWDDKPGIMLYLDRSRWQGFVSLHPQKIDNAIRGLLEKLIPKIKTLQPWLNDIEWEDELMIERLGHGESQDLEEGDVDGRGLGKGKKGQS